MRGEGGRPDGGSGFPGRAGSDVVTDKIDTWESGGSGWSLQSPKCRLSLWKWLQECGLSFGGGERVYSEPVSQSAAPHPQLGKQSWERWGLSGSLEGLVQNRTKDRKTRAAWAAWPSKVQVGSSLPALAPEKCGPTPERLKRAQQPGS